MFSQTLLTQYVLTKTCSYDQVCLTVRHVDGFHLWPTAANNYSVRASPWRGGHGDVVADFVASAAKFRMGACFYIILGFNVWANQVCIQGFV